MRTYGQYCAMTRALDVIGDRWTMLIVRELWLRPQRFSTLAAALPGAASNLLTERLRALISAGVVERNPGPPAVYSLTERGFALMPVMEALTRWGEAEMTRAAGDDGYRNEWFAQAFQTLVPPDAVREPLKFRLALDGGGPWALLTAEPGAGVFVERGADPDLAGPVPQITGDPEALVAVLGGRGHPDDVLLTGPAAAIKRLRALLARVVRLRGAEGASL